MLVNSLLLLFAFTPVISPLEASLVGIVTLVVVFWLTPPPNPAEPTANCRTLYQYLQASWLGRVSLAAAFLPFFVLFNAMLLYIDERAINGTFTLASWVTMHVIFTMPLIYWTGAVWRCSAHCSHKIWAVIARCVTVSAFYDYALRLILLLDYPNLIVSCGRVMIEAGGCWE